MLAAIAALPHRRGFPVLLFLAAEITAGVPLWGGNGSCVPAPLDLVAWWPFDETSGTIAEEWVAGNDGVHFNGPTPVPATVAGGLHLDGGNDYVSVADADALDFGTGDFSIEGWIDGATQLGSVRVILDKRQPSYFGYHLYTYNGSLGLQLADGGFTNYNSNAFVADGAPHHIAVTVDRNQADGLRFYVDGVEAQRFNPTGRQGSLDNPAPLRFGTVSFSLSGFFRGTLPLCPCSDGG